jgi:hypothetical protein
MKSRINWFFHLRLIYYLRSAWMSTHKMQCEFAQHLKKGPTVGESNTWITQKTSLRNHWSGHLHLTFCVDPYIVKGFASTSGLYREEVRQARPI